MLNPMQKDNNIKEQNAKQNKTKAQKQYKNIKNK